MRRIVIIGATSAIVHETAKHFAMAGDALFLVARNEQKLFLTAKDLLARGASSALTKVSDLTSESSIDEIHAGAVAALQEIDLVYIGYGSLTDQKRGEIERSYAYEELQTNFTSVVGHCLLWAKYFEARKNGQIAVITSVAGDRGRRSNYLYGAAKGGLSLFLGGLRNRLSRAGVAVTDIKPGFIDTPMTAAIKKGPLFAPASVAGRIIHGAITSRKDIVYVPWFWRIILGIICGIPEKIFKKLSL